MRKGVGFEGDSASSAGRIGTQHDVDHTGDDGLTERISDGNHLNPRERREAAVTVPHIAVSRENRAQRSRPADKPFEPAATCSRRTAVRVTPLNGTQKFSNRAPSPVFVRAGF